MAIELNDGFEVKTNLPIDARYVVADIVARDALVPEVRYLGLPCYVVSEKKRFILKEGITNADWEEDGGSGSGNGSSGTFLFLSSKNSNPTEWYPSQGTFTLTQTGTILFGEELTWESIGGAPTLAIITPYKPKHKTLPSIFYLLAKAFLF